MKKRLFSVKIAAAILTFTVGWSSIAADCTFKKDIGGTLTEVDTLTSGEIRIYAPKLSGGASGGIFSGATAKIMRNDDVTEATADGSALNALDGDNKTEVSAEEKDWNLLITLKKEKTFDNISVTFSDTVYPWHFTIKGAAEGGEWFTIKDVNKNKTGGVKNYSLSEAVTAKYIRISNEAPDVRQMRICEVSSSTEDTGGEEGEGLKKILAAGLYNKELNRMYLFDTKEISADADPEEAYIKLNVDGELTGLPEEIPELENLMTGAKGQFISISNGGELPPSTTNNVENIPENAFDGDVTTKAAGAMEWNYIFQADMGEVKTVGKVVINFAPDCYPTSFDILASADGAAWSTVASKGGNYKAGIHEFAFESVQARYIRIRDNVAQEDVRQMGIAELEAYERDFSSEFEVRAFMINSMEDKTPFTDLAILR